MSGTRYRGHILRNVPRNKTSPRIDGRYAMQRVVEGRTNSMRQNSGREKEKSIEFFCIRQLDRERKSSQEKGLEIIKKGWRIWNNKRMSAEERQRQHVTKEEMLKSLSLFFNEERNRNEEKNRQEVEKFMLKEAQPDKRTDGGGIEVGRLVAEENTYRQVSVETQMSMLGWNVRTLTLQPEENHRKEARKDQEIAFHSAKMPMLEWEFIERGVQLACLLETRLAKELYHDMKIVGVGGTLHYSGCFMHPKTGPMLGVAIWIAKDSPFVVHDSSDWHRVSPRIMWVVGTINGTRMAIFSVHAPTNGNENETEEFYVLVVQQLKMVPAGIAKIFLGDFNARVMPATTEEDNVVVGKFGQKGISDGNGEALIGFCAGNDLCISDSFYPRPNYSTWKCRDTWQPNAAIDHILTNGVARLWVKDCGVTDLDLESDHRAMMVSLAIPGGVMPVQGLSKKPDPRKKKKKEMRYDKGGLKIPDTRKQYETRLREALMKQEVLACKDKVGHETLNVGDPGRSEYCDVLQSAIRGTIARTMPRARKKKDDKKGRQEWFDPYNVELVACLQRKREAYGRRKLNPDDEECCTTFNKCQADAQRQCRLMFKQFWAQEAFERNNLFESGRPGPFYKALKKPLGSQGKNTDQTKVFFQEDGITLTTTKEEYTHRWGEHCRKVLNQETLVDLTKLENDGFLPAMMTEVAGGRFGDAAALDNPYTVKEVEAAMNAMHADTVAGLDGICPEFYKSMKDLALASVLTEFYNSVLESGDVPAQLKDVILTILYKSGDVRNCNNHRTLSLINVIGKILERLLANRMAVYCELQKGILPEEQYGFRAGRSTIDAIFLSRVIDEAALAKGEQVYKCFIDLTKAYDKVNRGLLFKILELRGFPPKTINVIKGLLLGSIAHVRLDGEICSTFALECGLKQGSVLSPLLFNIFLGAIIEVFHSKLDAHTPGIGGVAFAYDFTSTGLEPLSKTGVQAAQLAKNILLLRDIFFADDGVLLAAGHNAGFKLGLMISIFSEVCVRYGQEVSCPKTKCMLVGGNCREAGTFALDSENTQILEWVEEFKHLGCMANGTGTAQHEIAARRQKMLIAFNALRARLFRNRHASIVTKLVVFNAVIMSVALYACDIWNSTAAQVESLEKLQFKLLRLIFRFRKRDFMSREAIIQRAAVAGVTIVPIAVLIHQRRLRFLGRVENKPNSSYLKQVLHGELLSSQSRKPGASKTSFRSAVKYSLRACSISEIKWDAKRKLPEDEWQAVVAEGGRTALAEWTAKRLRASEDRAEQDFQKLKPLSRAILGGQVQLRGGAPQMARFRAEVVRRFAPVNLERIL